jgi:hypothetical protein
MLPQIKTEQQEHCTGRSSLRETCPATLVNNMRGQSLLPGMSMSTTSMYGIPCPKATRSMLKCNTFTSALSYYFTLRSDSLDPFTSIVQARTDIAFMQILSKTPISSSIITYPSCRVSISSMDGITYATHTQTVYLKADKPSPFLQSLVTSLSRRMGLHAASYGAPGNGIIVVSVHRL